MQRSIEDDTARSNNNRQEKQQPPMAPRLGPGEAPCTSVPTAWLPKASEMSPQLLEVGFFNNVANRDDPVRRDNSASPALSGGTDPVDRRSSVSPALQEAINRSMNSLGGTK